MTTWPMTLALATLALGMAACSGSPQSEPAKTEAKQTSAPTEPAKTEVAKAEPPKAAEPTKAAEPPVVAPEPPKPAGLVGPLPPVKDEKTPAVVFAALVDRNSGEWEVDIVDFAGMDVKKLEKQLEAQMTAAMSAAVEDEEENPDRELPSIFETKDGKALIPPGFAVGDPWTLVTADGAEHRTAKGLRARVAEGSGQLHFYVDLGKPLEDSGGPAVAFRGHLPTTTKLTVPTPTTAIALGPDVLDELVGELAAKLDPEARELLRGNPIEQSHVELYPGRFPGERTHAAFIMTDENEDDPPLSAFLLVKAKGSAEIAAIPDVLGTVKLMGLLDVDGDGFDEVFYEDAYHEGWYLMMLQWEGGEPRKRVLTGDGI
jgi:hypothetical protein